MRSKHNRKNPGTYPLCFFFLSNTCQLILLHQNCIDFLVTFPRFFSKKLWNPFFVGATPMKLPKELGNCGKNKGEPYKNVSCNKTACQKPKPLSNPWKTWKDCPEIFKEEEPLICDIVQETVGPGCIKPCKLKPRKTCRYK